MILESSVVLGLQLPGFAIAIRQREGVAGGAETALNSL